MRTQSSQIGPQAWTIYCPTCGGGDATAYDTPAAAAEAAARHDAQLHDPAHGAPL